VNEGWDITEAELDWNFLRLKSIEEIFGDLVVRLVVACADGSAFRAQVVDHQQAHPQCAKFAHSCVS
jgi:hypothetical protein